MARSSHQQGQRFPTIYWRALLAYDGGEENDKQNDFLYVTWQHMRDYGAGPTWQPLTTLDNDNSKALGFQNRMKETCIGRKLITTEKNVLGLAPGDACKNDLICFLDGASIPMVIREDHETKRSTFVGECYLQGDMQLAKAWDAEGGSIFTLY
ncbi:hypothetical protein MMC14_009817 [Varicellaria rhodocarpa]|nr:hypothetical protein [Varicellaria rhodocarpa]